MNYFDYFSEIEDEFVRRRGSHLLVSTLDWSLMETWRQRGIPLHIVLRAINQTFDQYDQRQHRGRKVNSLLFCRQAVEENYFDYLASRVGNDSGVASAQGPDPLPSPSADRTDARDYDKSPEPFSLAGVTTHLREKTGELSDLAGATASHPLREALLRAIDRLEGILSDLEMASTISPERLEQDLTLIEGSILASLLEAVSPEALAAMKAAGKKMLRGYRETMTPEIYRQTLDNFVARELRQLFRIPRLSLFYIKL